MDETRNQVRLHFFVTTVSMNLISWWWVTCTTEEIAISTHHHQIKDFQLTNITRWRNLMKKKKMLILCKCSISFRIKRNNLSQHHLSQKKFKMFNSTLSQSTKILKGRILITIKVEKILKLKIIICSSNSRQEI